MTTLMRSHQDGSISEGFRYIEDHQVATFEASAWYSQLAHERVDSHSEDVDYAALISGSERGAETREAFEKLTSEWKDETIHLSSPASIAMHPSYQQIIGMGTAALPLILQDLERAPAQWFLALRAIARESPVRSEDRGDIIAMTRAWLDWGKRRQYLPTTYFFVGLTR